MLPDDLHLSRRLARKDPIFAGILALAAALVYLPTLGYDFVNWDDPLYVYENPHVIGGLTPDSIRWAMTSYDIAYWIPLTWLSLQTDATFWGLNPTGYHLTNLLLHALDAGLLFLILRRMGLTVGPSLAAAALWAFHPQHVESVAWVTERKDVLSTLFGLLALGAYVRYTESPSAGRMACVCIMMALSMAAKPMLITFPFTLLLLDYWPLRRLQSLGDLKPRIREKAALFLLAVTVGGFTWYTQSLAGATRPEDMDRPAADRVSNAVFNAAIYVRQAFIPVSLAALYPRTERSTTDVALAGALLISVTAITIALRFRLPSLLVGWFWFLIALAPVLGLAAEYGPHAYADRNTYWPHLIFFAALATAAAEIFARWRVPLRVQVVIASVIIVFNVILTLRQETIWENSASLWEHTIRVTGDNGMAHLNLGIHEYNHARRENAVIHLKEAYRLAPNHFLSAAAYAEVLDATGAFDEAERVARQALSLGPPPGRRGNISSHLAAIRVILGDAAKRQGRFAEATEHYWQSLEARETWEAWNKRGVLLALQGQPVEAAKSFSRARTLEPGSAEVAFNLGMSLAESNAWAAALPHLDEAARLAPTKPNYLGMLAVAHLAEGHRDEATRTAAAAARLDRTWPTRSAALAWTLSTHPDATRRKGLFAYPLARTVVLISPTPEALDVAAAAAAEMGRFEEACHTADSAATAAEAAGRASQAAAIRMRIEGYKSQQPYRSPPVPKP